MDGTLGSVGTRVGLALRLGQTVFSMASLLFMSVGVEFYSFTAFCFLVTIMGLVIPWSFSLAVVDIYSMCAGCHPQFPGIMVVVTIGDWTLSMLSLAAACSTAAVVDFLIHSSSYFAPKTRGRCQLSAAMAFLSWFLTAISSLCNLWLNSSL